MLQIRGKVYGWMKKNNKGMSLVEIIIVIAIVGILAVASISLAGNIKYANTQKAVESIEDKLDNLQVTTMSKATKQYLYIYRVGGNYYAKVSSTATTDRSNALFDDKGTKLSNSAMTIYYDSHTGAGKVMVGSDNFIRICYNRAGAFYYQGSGSTTLGTNCDKIYVNGSREYAITLVEETGKHYVE